jgi:hypothetical protein
LNELLSECGVSINENAQEFFIGNLSETVLPAAAKWPQWKKSPVKPSVNADPPLSQKSRKAD